MRKRLTASATVGRRAYRLTVLDASRPGEPAGNEVAVSAHFLFVYHSCPAFGKLQCPTVGDRAAATVFRCALHDRAKPFIGKIIVDRRKKLLPGDGFFLFDAFFNCGKGIDTPDYEELKDTMLHYPEWQKSLPPLDAIKNVSETGAVFRPGEIGILDSVADAFDVLPIGTETIANRLYGADCEGAHLSILSGLMLVAYPLKSVDISVVPSKETIQSFLVTSNQEEEENA